MSTKGHKEHLHFVCPRRATFFERRATRKPLWDHDLVCPRRAEQSTKGREGPRRKPLRDHDLVCPREHLALRDHDLVHEGRGRTPFLSIFCPRRAAKDREENLCGIMIWSVHEGQNTFFAKGAARVENTFCPRRAAKGHEENLCGRLSTKGGGEHLLSTKKTFAGSRREGRTPFLSTKGHEGPRRKPLRDHDLVCPRRAGENTFFVYEGPRRKPLVVDSSRLAALAARVGFEGGVAGGVPPHKGGPQARPPRWATATGGACGAASASPEPP